MPFGTGLGLATVAMVVKNSRGVIDIQSELGKGTTFSVYLPAAKQNATAAQDSLPTVQRASAPRSILLVDDESAITEMMREALQSAGHRVATAASGFAADALLAEKKFDFALVDLMLPGEEIGETFRRLSALGQRMLAMSGLGDEEREDAGVADAIVLQKPFTFPALLQIIEEASSAVVGA